MNHATFPVQMTDFQEAVNVHLSPQLSAAVTMTCYHATTENIFTGLLRLVPSTNKQKYNALIFSTFQKQSERIFNLF